MEQVLAEEVAHPSFAGCEWLFQQPVGTPALVGRPSKAAAALQGGFGEAYLQH